MLTSRHVLPLMEIPPCSSSPEFPMTKLRTSRLFSFVARRGRKGGNVRKFGLPKMFCAVFLFCATTAIAAPAQTFTTLVNFDDGNDGGAPLASLIQATDGNCSPSIAGWPTQSARRATAPPIASGNTTSTHLLTYQCATIR